MNVVGLHWCCWSVAGSRLPIVLWTAWEHWPVITENGQQRRHHSAENTEACRHTCRQVRQRSLGCRAESYTDTVEETEHGLQIMPSSHFIVDLSPDIYSPCKTHSHNGARRQHTTPTIGHCHITHSFLLLVTTHHLVLFVDFHWL